MMRWCALVALLAMGLAAVATLSQRGDAHASASDTVTLSFGDKVRVHQAEVGCRVTRLAGHGNRAYVDCRRAGSLRGTYGAYFGEDKVLVVRYVDSRTARLVFQGRHEESPNRCR